MAELPDWQVVPEWLAIVPQECLNAAGRNGNTAELRRRGGLMRVAGRTEEKARRTLRKIAKRAYGITLPPDIALRKV